MESFEELNQRENVRTCLALGWFHMLERSDLEKEITRLEEKNLRYLECIRESTERTSKRIRQIQEFMKQKEAP